MRGGGKWSLFLFVSKLLNYSISLWQKRKVFYYPNQEKIIARLYTLKPKRKVQTRGKNKTSTKSGRERVCVLRVSTTTRDILHSVS